MFDGENVEEWASDFKTYVDELGITRDDYRVIMEYINDALALLQEREVGKWIRLTGMAPPEYHGHKICSVCESFAPYDPLHPWREMLSPYCPACGAKMEVTEDA